MSGMALRIKWVPAKGQVAHATVVAGLAFDKRATQRNAVKRRLREILRPLLEALRAPYDLMIFVNKSAATRSFSELRHELIALLKKGGLL